MMLIVVMNFHTFALSFVRLWRKLASICYQMYYASTCTTYLSTSRDFIQIVRYGIYILSLPFFVIVYVECSITCALSSFNFVMEQLVIR